MIATLIEIWIYGSLVGTLAICLAASGQFDFWTLPKQSRGLAATAKGSESETGISITQCISVASVSERLPGAGGCNSPLMSKKAELPQACGCAAKTGYVLAENSRQVPSLIIFPSGLNLTYADPHPLRSLGSVLKR